MCTPSLSSKIITAILYFKEIKPRYQKCFKYHKPVIYDNLSLMCVYVGAGGAGWWLEHLPVIRKALALSPITT